MTTTFRWTLSLIERPLVLLIGDLLHPVDNLAVKLLLDGDMRHGRGGQCAMPMLFAVHEARRKASRPSLVYCGDDRRGKKVAAGLIRDAGFDAVDAGPLRIARYTEPFALLIGQLAYEGEEGPELAYRFERFGK